MTPISRLDSFNIILTVGFIVAVLVIQLSGCPPEVDEDIAYIKLDSSVVDSDDCEVVIPPHIVRSSVVPGHYNSGTIVTVVRYDTEDGELLVTIATRSRGCGVAQTLIKD